MYDGRAVIMYSLQGETKSKLELWNFRIFYVHQCVVLLSTIIRRPEVEGKT